MKIARFGGSGLIGVSVLVRRGVFVLQDALRVDFEGGMSLTVPAGFPFDGASIPPRARSAIQSLTIAGYVAFVVHDYAYAEGATWVNAAGLAFSISRADADGIARALCDWLKLDEDDRIEIYDALRLFGGASYHRLPVDRTVDQVAEGVRT